LFKELKPKPKKKSSLKALKTISRLFRKKLKVENKKKDDDKNEKEKEKEEVVVEEVEGPNENEILKLKKNLTIKNYLNNVLLLDAIRLLSKLIKFNLFNLLKEDNYEWYYKVTKSLF